MPDLTGAELENHGKAVLEKMGLNCFIGRKQTRLQELSPRGNFGPGEHLELDYLIPYGRTCLIGEITSRKISSSIRDKYNKFRLQLELLANLELTDRIWSLLGIQPIDLPLFRDVTDIKGFIVLTGVQKFDINLEHVDNVAVFYRSEFKVIEEYSDCIGKYSKEHFLSLFNLVNQIPRRPIQLSQAHNLLRTTNKKVASGLMGLADAYFFEVSPYEILPLAKVYRRDMLPDLDSALAEKYQRPLISSKLKDMRKILLESPDFMFPNNILVVLSNSSTYDRVSNTLNIPDVYGSISVIDGQHRLFSYADNRIQDILGPNAKLMVTGLKFIDATDDQINKFSAKTFIEINMNQTTVKRGHLDGIAYEILGDISSNAIAAHIIFKINERPGRIYGLFDTSQTNLGIIKSTTVVVSLKSITNINRIQSLVNARSGGRLLEKNGFTNLLDERIENLSESDTFIQKFTIAFERYCNTFGSKFRHDWPGRPVANNTSLQYTKVFQAIVRLFGQFIKEGSNWVEVENQIEMIKVNLMSLRNITTQTYSAQNIILDHTDPNIPSAQEPAGQVFRFFMANRVSPTSITRV